MNRWQPRVQISVEKRAPHLPLKTPTCCRLERCDRVLLELRLQNTQCIGACARATAYSGVCDVISVVAEFMVRMLHGTAAYSNV